MGRIVSIKRFEIHDGDGVRTTLFLKGCPLKCRWCHNPESISLSPILSYNKEKCLSCLECTGICDCHGSKKLLHIFKREDCTACGKCSDVCLGDALVLYGKEVTTDEILPKLLEDEPFFKESNGGVTLSGGEPLLQADFTAEILKKLKENDIHTAVDTCGFVSRQNIDKVLPYTDVFLYDIKAIDESVHINCTGVSNKIILENLKYIDGKSKNIEIRIPFIPTMNDSEMDAIAKFLSEIKNIKKIKILPYHGFGASKYTNIGEEYQLNINLPTEKELIDAVKIFEKYGLKATRE